MNLRMRLRQPEPFLVTFSIIAAMEVVEMAALAGFDGIILDTEHAAHGIESLPPLIAAARSRGIYPIARVRANDPSLIGAALDAGAAGVMVPQIGSAAQAKAAVSAARFSPSGARGANPWVRAADFGSDARWFERANQEAAIILLIEGAAGIEALQDIAPIPDLDAVFLGPMDLSHSLGVPGETEHPKVLQAIADAVRHTEERRIRSGVFTPHASKVQSWVDRGVRFVAVSIDTIIIKRAFERVVAEAKGRA